MRVYRFISIAMISMALLAFGIACGGEDPTPTPKPAPTATPVPAAAPTATPVPSSSGSSSAAPTATPVPPTATPEPKFDAEAYFGNKTIRVITGTSPGGGYDVFSRLVSATAEKYFPESTRFVVQNLPGGGQYRGLRALLDADPDGLTTGPVHSRWFQRQAIVGDITDFDLEKIYILGSPTFSPRGDVFCVDKKVASSWEEVLALGRPLLMGAAGPGNEPAVEFMAKNGGPFKLVYGYGGTSEIMAAFDRGELDFTNRCGPSTAGRLFPEWAEEGRLVPLFYEKKPVSSDYLATLGYTGKLPSFLDLPGLTVDPKQLEALQANLLVTDLSRVFILPEGVPADVRKYWQDQFDKIMVDEGFIESLGIAGYTDSYGYGKSGEMLDIVRRVRDLDPSTRELVLEMSGVGKLVVN